MKNVSCQQSAGRFGHDDRDGQRQGRWKEILARVLIVIEGAKERKCLYGLSPVKLDKCVHAERILTDGDEPRRAQKNPHTIVHSGRKFRWLRLIWI